MEARSPPIPPRPRKNRPTPKRRNFVKTRGSRGWRRSKNFRKSTRKNKPKLEVEPESEVEPDQVEPNQVDPNQVPDQVDPDQVAPDQGDPDIISPAQQRYYDELNRKNELKQNILSKGSKFKSGAAEDTFKRGMPDIDVFNQRCESPISVIKYLQEVGILKEAPKYE